VPRITVTTDRRAGKALPSTLLDERVHSVHLSSRHAAAQLIERLTWAIMDAEQREAAHLRRL
jgi:hypothetical protein